MTVMSFQYVGQPGGGEPVVWGSECDVGLKEVCPQGHPPHHLPQEKGQGREVVRWSLQASANPGAFGAKGLAPDSQLERDGLLSRKEVAVCARGPREERSWQGGVPSPRGELPQCLCNSETPNSERRVKGSTAWSLRNSRGFLPTGGFST